MRIIGKQTEVPAKLSWLISIAVTLAAGFGWGVYFDLQSQPEALRNFYVCYVGVALLAHGIWTTPWASTLSTQLTILLITIASGIKIKLLNQPLLAQDIIYIGKDLANNMGVAIKYPLIVAQLCLAAAIYIGSPLFIRHKERQSCKKGSVMARWKILLCTCGAIAMTATIWQLQFGIKSQRITQNLGAYHGTAWFGMRRTDNPIVRFISSFYRKNLVEYNDAEKAERFSHHLRQQAISSQPSDIAKPDIMVVLQESHADIQVLDERLHLPPLPPSKYPLWQGLVRVPTFGGGTWLSEFGFLTGTCWGDFGINGAYAPYTLAYRFKRGLPRYLKSIGYHTIAIYSVEGQFLNARQAYASYGFETFIDANELTNTERNGWYDLPDDEIYTRALKAIKTKAIDDRPLFVFILTIQNHGPHLKEITAERADIPPYPKEIHAAVTNYVNLYQRSNEALAALRDTWLSAHAPRILATFGDHWPSLEGCAMLMGSSRTPPIANRNYYLTPANIWSNIVIPPPAQNEIDLCYFASSILKSASIPRDDYWQANTILCTETNGKYIDHEEQSLIEDYLTFCRIKLNAWE